MCVYFKGRVVKSPHYKDSVSKILSAIVMCKLNLIKGVTVPLNGTLMLALGGVVGAKPYVRCKWAL